MNPDHITERLDLYQTEFNICRGGWQHLPRRLATLAQADGNDWAIRHTLRLGEEAVADTLILVAD